MYNQIYSTSIHAAAFHFTKSPYQLKEYPPIRELLHKNVNFKTSTAKCIIYVPGLDKIKDVSATEIQ